MPVTVLTATSPSIERSSASMRASAGNSTPWTTFNAAHATYWLYANDGASSPQYWVVTWTQIPLPGTVSSLVADWWTYGTAGGASNGTSRAMIRIPAGTKYYSSSKYYASWTAVNYEWTTDPSGGGLTCEKVNSYGYGIEIGTDNTHFPSAGEMTWTATWAPDAGGFAFAFLVASLAGAALGLHELPGLAAAIYRRTGTLITPDEYREAWSDIRSARWPSFAGHGL